MQLKSNLLILIALVLWTELTAVAAPAPGSPRVTELIAILRDGHELERSAACQELGRMGARAKAAVPALLMELGDKSSRTSAAYALARIAPDDPAAAAALIAALNDPDPFIREEVASCLAETFPPLTAAVPALARQAREADAYPPIVTLAQWGSAAAEAVPTLIELIESKPYSMHALSRMGPAARPAIPKIIAMLKKPGAHHADVEAAMALANLADLANAAVPDLVAATQENDPAVRVAAAFALGRMGCDPTKLPACSPPFKEADQPIRAAFAIGLAGASDPSGSTSIHKLLEACDNPDAQLKKIARDALVEAGEHNPVALFDAFDSTDWQIQIAAASALLKLGRIPTYRENAPVRAGIARAAAHLNNPEPRVRGWAGIIVMILRPTTVPQAVLDAVKSREYDIRMDAAMALKGVTGDDQATGVAVAALIELMKDDNRLVRATAAYALESFGPAAGDAVPLLIKALSDHDNREFPLPLPHRPLTAEERVSLEPERQMLKSLRPGGPGLRALTAIGPGARDAVPELIKMLKGKTSISSCQVVEALGAIGPGAAQAVPDLVALLDDEHVQYCVPDALARMGEPGIKALIVALKGKPSSYLIVKALGRCGRNAVPALAAALAHGDPSLRGALIEILGKLGPRAEAAIPVLLQLAKAAAGEETRTIATLGSIGPAAVPALIELLETGNRVTRFASLDALAGIGPAAKSALPAISRAAKDSDEDLAGKAADAVRAIAGESRARP